MLELKDLKNGQNRLETRMEGLDSRMGILETRMGVQENRTDSMESRQDGMFQVLKALEDGLNIARADIEVIKESQFRFEGRLARIEHNQELMQDDIRHLFRRDLRREEEIAELKKAVIG